MFLVFFVYIFSCFCCFSTDVNFFLSHIILELEFPMELAYFSFALINVALAHLSRLNVISILSLNAFTVFNNSSNSQSCSHIILPCKITNYFSLRRCCIHIPCYWNHGRGAIMPNRKRGETMSHPEKSHTCDVFRNSATLWMI